MVSVLNFLKYRWISVYFLIVVFWTVYRYLFQYPEWIDEFIAKPLLQVLPVLLTVFFLEKKSFGTLGVSAKKPMIQLGVGLLVGGVLFVEAFVMKQMNHAIRTVPIDSLLLAFFVSLATGLTEELVFRGYFTSRIMEAIENVYVANAVQTLLFIVIHIPLMIFLFHYSIADMAAYSLQIGILGYIYGIVYIKQESIIPSTVAHTIWNFSNVLFK